MIGRRQEDLVTGLINTANDKLKSTSVRMSTTNTLGIYGESTTSINIRTTSIAARATGVSEATLRDIPPIGVRDTTTAKGGISHQPIIRTFQKFHSSMVRWWMTMAGKRLGCMQCHNNNNNNNNGVK